MVLNKYYGDTGVDQLDTGGNPIFTFLSSVVASGKILADDGKSYDTPSTALSNASNFMLFGAGSFNDNITITTNDITLTGVGFGSQFTGSAGSDTIRVNGADNVRISSLRLENTSSSGTFDVPIKADSTPTELTIDSCIFTEEKDRCIRIENGSDHLITNCIGDDIEGSLSNTNSPARVIVNSNIMRHPSGASDTRVSYGISRSTVLSNNISVDCKDSVRAIDTFEFDEIVYGNRVINPSGDGINSESTDIIIDKNRISDAGGTAINTSSATNPTVDDNETGTAN